MTGDARHGVVFIPDHPIPLRIEAEVRAVPARERRRSDPAAEVDRLPFRLPPRGLAPLVAGELAAA